MVIPREVGKVLSDLNRLHGVQVVESVDQARPDKLPGQRRAPRPSRSVERGAAVVTVPANGGFGSADDRISSVVRACLHARHYHYNELVERARPLALAPGDAGRVAAVHQPSADDV